MKQCAFQRPVAIVDICPVSAAEFLSCLSSRISVLSQQQTSVLSQQRTTVLSQQKASILSQQKTRRLLAAGQQLLGLLFRQDRCLLFRKALAWPVRAVHVGSTRRGLTRGEESEEGGSVPNGRRTGPGFPPFFIVFGGLKIDAKIVPKKR